MILKAKQGLIPSILGLFERLTRFSKVGFYFPDDKDIPNLGANTKFHLINASKSYVDRQFLFLKF